MQNTPLGMDEETIKSSVDSLRSSKAFKKGFKLGYVSVKHNELAENPYTLPPDMWEILRKRTRWQLGFEEGRASYKAKHQNKKKRRHEQVERIKDLTKKKHKHKHKHKHGH